MLIKKLYVLEEEIEKFDDFLEEGDIEPLEIDFNADDKVIEYIKNDNRFIKPEVKITINEKEKSYELIINGKKCYLGKFKVKSREKLEKVLEICNDILVKEAFYGEHPPFALACIVLYKHKT